MRVLVLCACKVFVRLQEFSNGLYYLSVFTIFLDSEKLPFWSDIILRCFRNLERYVGIFCATH